MSAAQICLQFDIFWTHSHNGILEQRSTSTMVWTPKNRIVEHEKVHPVGQLRRSCCIPTNSRGLKTKPNYLESSTSRDEQHFYTFLILFVNDTYKCFFCLSITVVLQDLNHFSSTDAQAVAKSLPSRCRVLVGHLGKLWANQGLEIRSPNFMFFFFFSITISAACGNFGSYSMAAPLWLGKRQLLVHQKQVVDCQRKLEIVSHLNYQHQLFYTYT